MFLVDYMENILIRPLESKHREEGVDDSCAVHDGGVYRHSSDERFD